MKKLEVILLLILVLACSAIAQEVDSKILKAQEILNQSRAAISKTVKIESVKGFSIDYDVSKKYWNAFRSNDEEEFVSLRNSKLSWSIPNKINLQSESEVSVGGNFTNLEQTKIILNADNLFSNYELFDKDGLRITYLDANSLHDLKESRNTILSDTFDIFFPITLDSTLNVSLKFSYIGITELEKSKASVIEATSKNTVTYRLFFDDKTHLLLLMTETWKNKEGTQFENKHFYLNYKEMDGLLVAQKIVSQNTSRKSGSSETIIKSIKINPTFKPNFFDVKK